MKWLNPILWPIRWQIAVLMIFTQIIAHLATIFAIGMSFQNAGGAPNDLAVSQSEPFLTALRMTPATAGPEDLAALLRADDRFRVLEAPPSAVNTSAGLVEERLQQFIIDALPASWRDRISFFATDKGFFSTFPVGSLGLVARLDHGGWLVFEPRGDTLAQNVPRLVALLGLMILALPLMFFSVWAGATLVSPIAALAKGAEHFAGRSDASAIPERGAVEVRNATRAFNQMRQRIQKLVQDRAQTLASIGHDMRTPLTRLRLRLEQIDDPNVADAIEGDVETLERMIDDALAFLRAENRPLSIAAVDVAVLAKTVADEYADRGNDIRYEGPARLSFLCDHEVLRRVLDNLVGNAAKFATTATIRLTEQKSGSVSFDIQDNGPGIPPDQRDKVLQPFTKIDAVRAGTAQKSQGFGLGLAIARDLIERHGGHLVLSENQPQGLKASFKLPRLSDGARPKDISLG